MSRGYSISGKALMSQNLYFRNSRYAFTEAATGDVL